MTIYSKSNLGFNQFHRPEDEKRMVVILREDQYDEGLDAPPSRSMAFCSLSSPVADGDGRPRAGAQEDVTDTLTPPRIARKHLTRLREIYRSSGWPCRDPLEVDLIVGGLVQAERDDQGRETLHLTQAGLQALADAHATNRASRSAHDELVMKVAQHMQQEGRIAWTQVALRAQVEGVWTQAIPDVFSIRNTTVEAYLEPVVHEIKVSRADLLGDLKRPEKRAAYLAMASQVYYVLGPTATGQPIGEADEVPAECGVILASSIGLEIVRTAPKQPFTCLRFDVWMALARSAPLEKTIDSGQMHL